MMRGKILKLNKSKNDDSQEFPIKEQSSFIRRYIRQLRELSRTIFATFIECPPHTKENDVRLSIPASKFESVLMAQRLHSGQHHNHSRLQVT